MRVLAGFNLSMVLVLGLGTTAAFADGVRCEELFTSSVDSQYPLLRQDSAARDGWINSQVRDVNTYLAKSPNFSLFKSYMRKEFDKVSDGEKVAADGTAVWIRNQGVEVKDPGAPARTQVLKPTTVMIKRGNDPEIVLISSFDLQRNNGFMPTRVQISPDGNFVNVGASRHGSIDVYTQIIFDAHTGHEVGRVESTDGEAITWIQPGKALFSTYPTRAQSTFTITDGKLVVQALPRRMNVRSALNGQVLFAANATGTLLQRFGEDAKSWSITTKAVIDVAFLDDQKAILQTSGVGEFGEIILVRSTVGDGGARTYTYKTIVAETNWVVSRVSMYGSNFVATSFRGGDRKQQVFNADGDLVATVALPPSSGASLTDVNLQTNELSYKLSSPVRKEVVWKYRIQDGTWVVADGENWRTADIGIEMLKVDSIEYVVEYVNYKSADGETIPMRVTRRKDLQPNGKNPVLGEGYGGFGENVYFHPSYSKMLSNFLKNGGIHIAPALRGSRFFGRPWYDAGRALNKQNVVNDFIGGIEWMIQNNWSTPKQIAISGASHGGLIVGAIVTQRPDLVGLAFPQYGPQDFANKPTLDPNTMPLQISEYGDMYKDPAAQAYARQLSPFGNLKPDEYPTTVVITGRMDSRVNPAHSYLYAQKLQENQLGTAPVYLFALKNSGHWAASEPLQDNIAWRWNSVYWTFLYDYFGMTAPQ